MSSFRLAFHTVTGRRIVEVWEGDQLIASIYPEHRGVKIVSKFSMATIMDERPPAALQVILGEVPK